MINNDLKATVTWLPNNKEWYLNKGYQFTKIRDTFEVNVNDLIPTSKIKIHAKCDYCGEDTEVMYASYYKAVNHPIIKKYACSHCASRKSQEVSFAKRRDGIYENIQNICDEHDYTLLTPIEDIHNVRSEIKYICPFHGEQSSMLDNFTRGHLCYECGRISVGDKLRKNADTVKKEIEEINGNILLNPDDYKNAIANNLIILCGQCKKNTFVTSYSNYIRHGVNRCECCSQSISVGELNIRKYLENNNISYIPEKRFIDCRNIKPLPFDFYLPEYNAIIEFDGEQHYRDIRGKDVLLQVQRNDEIKNKYCEDKNIPLLRIPYWERNNEAHFISNFLNELNKIQVEDIV